MIPYWNNTRRIEQLAKRVRLAAIMRIKQPGRSLQLANENSFSSIYDKNACFRHEWYAAEKNSLLFDIPYVSDPVSLSKS